MTYSIQTGYTSAVLVQENNGDESTKEVSLSDFFQAAQSLGFFPEGQFFQDAECMVVFDFYGVERAVERSYQSMLEADCFGTEDLETIIKSFFDTFPEKLYWIKANNVEVLHRTPRRECDGKNWRLYATTADETRHIETGFIDTDWSEFQTSQKVAIEILIKQLEGHIKVLNHRLECLK